MPMPTYTPLPTVNAVPMRPTVVYPAPVLVSPDEGITVSRQATFIWSWTGPNLTENQGFEVRIWKEGQPDHYGAAAAVHTTSVTINIRGAYGVSRGGSGKYLWTVAVVQIEPYKRIGPEATPRTLIVHVDQPNKEPTLAPP